VSPAILAVSSSQPFTSKPRDAPARTGETTVAEVRQLGVFSGRVGQLRLAFRPSWSRFQGEPLPA
jgi:hypothetical protein